MTSKPFLRSPGAASPGPFSTHLLLAVALAGLGACAGGGDAGSVADAGLDGAVSSASGRVLVLDELGHIASLDLAPPHAVRATADRATATGSARCRGARCLVVHPSPVDTVELVDALDLHVVRTFPLESGADPRDVAFVDDATALVGQYGRAALLEVELATGHTTPIDLTALADADGLPETRRMAACGRRVFVQLLRLDASTSAPSPGGSMLAVVDLDRSGAERLVDVDSTTAATDGIALAGAPDFDMPVDCAAGTLYVAEPKPLFSGGGAYEQVNLATYVASDFPFASGAQVGGFEVVDTALVWRITHTDFGPGASSHLELVGGPTPDTFNTFAGRHADELALDRPLHLLFFPDPCTVTPSNGSCQPGVHVFDARSGAHATPFSVDVGFAPSEVAIAR